MKIGYLINQYPHVSHNFIRREIAAVEAAGVEVLRFSVRPSPEQLVDPGDVAERERTEVILAGGLTSLLLATIVIFFTRPIAWARGLVAAVRMGRRSERGI